MTNKWKYGDSWERYPIRVGETWIHQESGSHIIVDDLRNGLPEFMYGTEMIYCDPPWSKGNCNCFITKAGMKNYVDDYGHFLDCLFVNICEIDPACCYLEIGKENVNEVSERLKMVFSTVQKWEITYYKKHVCYLLRGGNSPLFFNFSKMDDENTPGVAIQKEGLKSVGDFCTGRGLTLMAAHKNQARFFGMELNQRRLAVAIDRASKIGVEYKRS